MTSVEFMKALSSCFGIKQSKGQHEPAASSIDEPLKGGALANQGSSPAEDSARPANCASSTLRSQPWRNLLRMLVHVNEGTSFEQLQKTVALVATNTGLEVVSVTGLSLTRNTCACLAAAGPAHKACQAGLVHRNDQVPAPSILLATDSQQPSTGAISSKGRAMKDWPSDWRGLHSQERITSLLAIPIRSPDKVVGMLTFASRDPDLFIHPQWEALLEILAPWFSRMFQDNQLGDYCSLLENMLLVPSITGLMKVISRTVVHKHRHKLYTGQVHCRLAVCASDGLSALLFDDLKSRDANKLGGAKNMQHHHRPQQYTAYYPASPLPHATGGPLVAQPPLKKSALHRTNTSVFDVRHDSTELACPLHQNHLLSPQHAPSSPAPGSSSTENRRPICLLGFVPGPVADGYASTVGLDEQPLNSELYFQSNDAPSAKRMDSSHNAGRNTRIVGGDDGLFETLGLAMANVVDPAVADGEGGGHISLLDTASTAALYNKGLRKPWCAAPSIADSLIANQLLLSSLGCTEVEGTVIKLEGTVLGEAINAKQGTWVQDCAAFMQDRCNPNTDVFLATSQDASGCLVVNVMYHNQVPILALYLTLSHRYHPEVLHQISHSINEMLSVLGPLVWAKLTGDLSDEWEYMQAAVLNVSCSLSQDTRRKARRASLDLTDLVSGQNNTQTGSKTNSMHANSGSLTCSTSNRPLSLTRALTLDSIPSSVDQPASTAPASVAMMEFPEATSPKVGVQPARSFVSRLHSQSMMALKSPLRAVVGGQDLQNCLLAADSKSKPAAQAGDKDCLPEDLPCWPSAHPPVAALLERRDPQDILHAQVSVTSGASMDGSKSLSWSFSGAVSCAKQQQQQQQQEEQQQAGECDTTAKRWPARRCKTAGAISPTAFRHDGPKSSEDAALPSRKPSFRVALNNVGSSSGKRMSALITGLQDRVQEAQRLQLNQLALAPRSQDLQGIHVISKIGSGGFASCYLAWYQGAQVALKVIHEKKGTQAEVFRNAVELAVMCTLSHPNIVQVLTFFTDVGVSYPRYEAFSSKNTPPLILHPLEADTADSSLMESFQGSIHDEHPNARINKDMLAAVGMSPADSQQQLHPRIRKALVICMEYCNAYRGLVEQHSRRKLRLS